MSSQSHLGHSIIRLLMICLPIAISSFILNYFISSLTGVALVSPTRWLSAVIAPLIFSHWGLENRFLAPSGAFFGFGTVLILTLSSYTFLLSLIVFFISSFKVVQRARRTRNISPSSAGVTINWTGVFTSNWVACILALIYMTDCGCGEQIIDLTHNYRCSWLSIAVIGTLSCSIGNLFSSTVTSSGTAKPFLFPSFKLVPRGTRGGINVLSIMLSFFGGLLIGVSYYLVLLVCIKSEILMGSPSQWPIVMVGGFGGLIGTLVAAMLSSVFQFSGLDQEGLVVHKPGNEVETISGADILDTRGVNMASSLITALALPYISLSFIFNT